MSHFSLYFIIFVISIIFQSLCIAISARFNLLMDMPNKRSSHTKVVPRVGGIPIILIFFTALLIINPNLFKLFPGYLLGAFVIAAVGITDDFINLKGPLKIMGMVAGALLPIILGIKLNYLPLLGNNEIILYVLSFIWIYGLINAFNFMDGIDGLMGGVGSIAFCFLAFFAFQTGNFPVMLISLILLSGCLAFLLFNYHPASVFLGDAGSMFIGYNLAILSIMIINHSQNQIPIYVPALVLSPIIFDSLVTFIKRGIKGKNVIIAHREHLYQRLIIIGYSHRSVSIIYFTLTVLGGLGAAAFIKSPLLAGMLIVALCLLTLVGFNHYVNILERRKKIPNVISN